HAFSSRDDAGFNPRAPLMQASDGALYGTTTVAGATAETTVFGMSLDGKVTKLVTVGGGPTGEESSFSALAQGQDGDLYGTMWEYLDTGSVFRTSLAGELEVLQPFTNAPGLDPDASLLPAADGSLYGTATAGGAFGYGTLFSMATDGTITVLHDF